MNTLLFKMMVLAGFSILISSCMVTGPARLSGSSTHMDNTYRGSGLKYDPVCGEPVNTSDAVNDLSWQYEGNVYYFHTEACMNTFKEAPQKYMHKNDDMHSNRWYGNAWIWGIGAVTMGAMMLLMFMH